MRKALLLSLALTLILALPAAAGRNDADPGLRDQIERLRADITLLNLLNGLNLSEEQYEALIALADEADSLHQGMLTAADPDMAAYRATLEELRGALLAGADAVPEDVGRRQHEGKEQLEAMRDGYAASLLAIEERTAAVFDAAQREVIDTFRPCMLPPQNQREPVRAGQGTTHGPIIERMRRLRELPAPAYERMREQMVSRLIARIEEHVGQLGDDERAAERERLLAFAERIRALSDLDFEIQKDQLAEEVRYVDRVETLRDEIQDLTEVREGPHPGRIARFFLTEGSASVLREKLAAIRATPRLPPTDLGTIEPAPDCDHGCATNP